MLTGLKICQRQGSDPARISPAIHLNLGALRDRINGHLSRNDRRCYGGFLSCISRFGRRTPPLRLRSFGLRSRGRLIWGNLGLSGLGRRGNLCRSSPRRRAGLGLRCRLRRGGGASRTRIVIAVQRVNVDADANADDQNQRERTRKGIEHQLGWNVFDLFDCFLGNFARLYFGLFFDLAVRRKRRCRRGGILHGLGRGRRCGRRRDIDFLERRQFGHLGEAHAAATLWTRLGHQRIDCDFRSICGNLPIGGFDLRLIADGRRHVRRRSLCGIDVRLPVGTRSLRLGDSR